jgi:hypothetical protein
MAIAARLHPSQGGARMIESLECRQANAMQKRSLQILFSVIFVSLTSCTLWASTRQSVFAWGGLTTPPDNAWTIATLCDAYFGFITFYVWVLWKEPRLLPRVLWFVGIMLLGNIAMSAYVLRQLARLKRDDSMALLLSTRNA